MSHSCQEGINRSARMHWGSPDHTSRPFCVPNPLYWHQEKQQLTDGDRRRHWSVFQFLFYFFVCFVFLLCYFMLFSLLFSLHHIILSYSFFFSINDRNTVFEGKFLCYLYFEYIISITTSSGSFLFTLLVLQTIFWSIMETIVSSFILRALLNPASVTPSC